MLVFIASIVEKVAQVVFGVLLAFVGIDAAQQGAELSFEIVQLFPQDFFFAVGFVEGAGLWRFGRAAWFTLGSC